MLLDFLTFCRFVTFVSVKWESQKIKHVQVPDFEVVKLVFRRSSHQAGMRFMLGAVHLTCYA